MRRRPLLAALLVLAASACNRSSPPTLDAGDNGKTLLSVGTGSAFDAETNLAADSTGHVVAAWMAISSGCVPSLGYTFSSDGGASWSAPKRLDAPGGRRSEDPSVALDSRGNAYLIWLGTAGGADYHIYLARAPVGGAFAAPLDVSGGSSTAKVDFPRVVVDAADRVLVTWLDRAGDALMFAGSSDGGSTFSAAPIAAAPGLGSSAGLVQPCVDPSTPTGAIYATWIAWNQAALTASIRLSRSSDGGQTWTPASAQAVADDALRLPPTCVVRGNNVWIAYSKGVDVGGVLSPATSLRVRHSADGGVTYDAERVAASGTADDRFLLPKLVGADGGKLVLDYYQGPTGGAASLMRAESTDGGVTFSSTVWSATGTFTVVLGNLCVQPLELRWLGDSIGLAAAGGARYAAFADNSSGASRITFVKE